jgi:hypothetical protein
VKASERERAKRIKKSEREREGGLLVGGVGGTERDYFCFAASMLPRPLLAPSPHQSRVHRLRSFLAPPSLAFSVSFFNPHRVCESVGPYQTLCLSVSSSATFLPLLPTGMRAAPGRRAKEQWAKPDGGSKLV